MVDEPRCNCIAVGPASEALKDVRLKVEKALRMGCQARRATDCSGRDGRPSFRQTDRRYDAVGNALHICFRCRSKLRVLGVIQLVNVGHGAFSDPEIFFLQFAVRLRRYRY